MNTDQPWKVMGKRACEQDSWMSANLPPYDTEGGLFSPSAKHWRRENGIGPWPEDYADGRLPTPKPCATCGPQDATLTDARRKLLQARRSLFRRGALTI